MEENEVPTAGEAVEISDDDKLWALLGWITGVVALIALFMEDKKQRPFIKYNAVLALVVIVVFAVLVSIISVVIPCFGLVSVVAFIYPIYLGIQAYQGKWVEVPWLTDFVKQQGWASTP